MLKFQFNAEKEDGCTYEETYKNSICVQVFANQLSKYITHRLDLPGHEFLTPYLDFGKHEHFIGLLLIERKGHR